MSSARPPILTPEWVEARVADIAARADDAEHAHALEYVLYQDVLSAIAAENCSDPQQCAATAMKVVRLKFPRWFA